MTSVRRHLSWRARQEGQRLREGSRRAATTCWGDFKNPDLAPIKLTFVILMGATQCVVPFVSLFLRSLGLTVQEAGIIFAIGPLLPIFAPALATIIAYKLSNFRCILVFTVALSGFVALLHIAVPPARTTPTYTDTLSFSITCNPDFILTPILTSNDNCDFLDKTVNIASVEAKNCGYMCNPPAIKIPQKILKDVKKLRARQTVNSTLHHICKIQGGKEEVFEQKCFRKNLNRSRMHENMPKGFMIHNLIVPVSKRLVTTGFNVENYTMSPDEARSVECFKGRVPKRVTIPRIVMDEDIPTPSKENESVTCEFHCHASIAHNLTCHKRSNSIEHNVVLTFWLFVAINIVSQFLIGLIYSLFEVAVVALLTERGQDYGLQRIYGAFGGMLFAPLTGFVIDYLGKGNYYMDFFVMFVLYCALRMISSMMLVYVDLRFILPPKSLRSHFCSICDNLEVFLLLSIVFIAGMCYGFIENFLPWHLADMGSPKWFIGLLTTIASLAAFPFLGFSGSICKKFGHFQAIAFGLVCYSIRFIGYSLVQQYYWCAPFEVLEGVTTGLLFTAAVVYGAKLSSRPNAIAFQGILATFHYGLGKSVGSLLGSFLMATFNARLAFQIFSGLSLITAFFYYLAGKLIILPRQAKLQRQQRAIMDMPVKIISKSEYKRQSKRQNDKDVEANSTLGRKKRQSPRPPKPDVQKDVEENSTLNETQMTDLPNDETLPLNDTTETQPAESNNTEANHTQDENDHTQNEEKDDAAAQNKENEETAAKNNVAEGDDETVQEKKSDEPPPEDTTSSPNDSVKQNDDAKQNNDDKA